MPLTEEAKYNCIKALRSILNKLDKAFLPADDLVVHSILHKMDAKHFFKHGKQVTSFSYHKVRENIVPVEYNEIKQFLIDDGSLCYDPVTSIISYDIHRIPNLNPDVEPNTNIAINQSISEFIQNIITISTEFVQIKKDLRGTRVYEIQSVDYEDISGIHENQKNAIRKAAYNFAALYYINVIKNKLEGIPKNPISEKRVELHRNKTGVTNAYNILISGEEFPCKFNVILKMI